MVALTTERRFISVGTGAPNVDKFFVKFRQHMGSSALRRRLVVMVVGSTSDIVVGPTRCQGAASCIST